MRCEYCNEEMVCWRVSERESVCVCYNCEGVDE